MEAKEKGVSAYLWLVLLTLIFALLLFVHSRGDKPTAGYSVKTQYASEETAPKRDKLNVNTASAQELEALTGIGPALAEAIVKDREENGAFETVEDLLRVKGIGESKLGEFRLEITTGGET